MHSLGMRDGSVRRIHTKLSLVHAQVAFPLPQSVKQCIIVSLSTYFLHWAVSDSLIACNRLLVGKMSLNYLIPHGLFVVPRGM
jgi:hypothetical protein